MSSLSVRPVFIPPPSRSPSSYSPPTGPVRTFTPAEVSLHSTVSDCWQILFGRVYDLTTYIPYHPGGVRLAMKNAGGDATEDFQAIHHSKRAQELFEAYWIGDLVGTQPRKRNPPNLGAALQKSSSLGVTGVMNNSSNTTTTSTSSDLLERKLSLNPSNEGWKAVRSLSQVKQSSNEPVIVMKSNEFTIQLSAPIEELTSQSPPLSIDELIDNEKPRVYQLISQNLSNNCNQTYIMKFKQIINYNELLLSSSSFTCTIDEYSFQPLTSILAGQHVQIAYQMNGRTSYRPYTPIEVDESSNPPTLTFLIKSYPLGTVSLYLSHLKVNQLIAVSGPFGQLKFSSLWQRMIHSASYSTVQWKFIVSGTGITPVYRVLQQIHHHVSHHIQSSNKSSFPFIGVQILFATRTEHEIYLQSEIESIRKQWKVESEEKTAQLSFTIHYALSKPTDEMVFNQWNENSQLNENKQFSVTASTGRIDRQLIQSWLSNTETQSASSKRGQWVGICGSDQFNRDLKQLIMQTDSNPVKSDEIFIFE
jgi:NAD(P)H-flavin reductase